MAEQEKKDVVREGEIVAAGMNQLATEMQTQRNLALAQPRDEKKVLQAAMAELAMVPEFAKKSYYVIPYRDGDRVVNVEGPSVKASRGLQRRWGNCATASRITADEGDRFQVEGIFIDYETNVVFRRTVSVSKFYIAKSTKLKTPLRDDRMTLALQAGMSKAERNATLAGLPVYLVEAYFKEAKRIAAGGITAAGGQGPSPAAALEKQYDALYRDFAKAGVVKERVAEYIKVKMGDKDPEDVIGTMLGILNAIEDNQISIDDVFGKPAAAPAGNGPVGASDLTGKK